MRENAKKGLNTGEDQEWQTERNGFQYNTKNVPNVNIFIDYKNFYNKGIITGDSAKFHDVFVEGGVSAKSEEESGDLLADNEQKLCDWIERNYYKISFAYLIACAFLNQMPYIWIDRVANKLGTLLYDRENSDSKSVWGQYRLSEFGAEIYKSDFNDEMGKMQIDFVRFSNDSHPLKILFFIWQSFPKMRMILTKWVIEELHHTKSMIAHRMIFIMGKLALQDCYYFSHELSVLFLEDNEISSDIALVQIVLELSRKQEYQKYFTGIIKNWNTKNDAHYLLVILLVYLDWKEDRAGYKRAISQYMSGLFYSYVKGQENEFSRCMFQFFAVGLRNYTFYKIMIETVYDFLMQKEMKRMRIKICRMFLDLFYFDVLLSEIDENKNDEAIFIKLACRDSDVRDKICEIWQIVWEKRKYHLDFYPLLGNYFVCFSEDIRKEKINLFVDSVFGNYCDIEHRVDILKKIQKCCRGEK